MDASNFVRTGQRHRWAVAAMFLVNGFLTGSWAPQIPLVLTRLQITEFTLGLLILVLRPRRAVGDAMVGLPDVEARHAQGLAAASPRSPPFGLLAVSRSPQTSGSRRSRCSSSAAMTGSMDVAMNANAVVVEQKLSRAVMSSSHGFWSLGGFAGGGARRHRHPELRPSRRMRCW